MPDVYTDIEFAKLDLTRQQRTGASETVYCSGKTKEQLLGILEVFDEKKIPVLGTRCSLEQYEFVRGNGINAIYDKISRILTLNQELLSTKLNGTVAVCCAGTSDLPVAEECAKVAEFLGASIQRYYDIGITGLHRLISKIDYIRTADVVVANVGHIPRKSTKTGFSLTSPFINILIFFIASIFQYFHISIFQYFHISIFQYFISLINSF